MGHVTQARAFLQFSCHAKSKCKNHTFSGLPAFWHPLPRTVAERCRRRPALTWCTKRRIANRGQCAPVERSLRSGFSPVGKLSPRPGSDRMRTAASREKHPPRREKIPRNCPHRGYAPTQFWYYRPAVQTMMKTASWCDEFSACRHVGNSAFKCQTAT